MWRGHQSCGSAIPYSVLRGGQVALESWQGAPSYTNAHSFPQTQEGPEGRAAQGQAENQTGRERRFRASQTMHAVCGDQGGRAEGGTGRGQQLLGPGTAPRPHTRQRAAWAWGAGGLPATWGALGGGLSVREAGALSNSAAAATATAGQAAAWQPVRRRQGWRA